MAKVYMQEACPWRVSENDFQGEVWFAKPMISFVQEFVCLCTRREVDGLRLGITYLKISNGIVRWHTCCVDCQRCALLGRPSRLCSLILAPPRPEMA